MLEQAEKFNRLGIATELVGEAQRDAASHRKLLHEETQIVLISPENLILHVNYCNMLLSERYKTHMVAFVVDEAHCIITWLVQLNYCI